MPKVALMNQNGDVAGDITLNDQVFGIEPNTQAVYDVVKSQRAGMRQGTHKVKGRSEVSGGGAKPWRQKGTGRARAGSNRSPIWVGGGTTFGPTPRKYTLKVNRKVRRLALKSVLSSKLQDQALIVLDDLALDSMKTKEMIAVLNNLKLAGKVIFVVETLSDNLVLAARNIPNITLATVAHASVYDLLKYKTVVLTEAAVKNYEEVLG
ncbi:MAG: 50S ribosomal protein L4 [Candidatus Izimaplasma sp.]|nr:50S ribosomal protein L4 [Candidatus Izimaplasma bacterium]